LNITTSGSAAKTSDDFNAKYLVAVRCTFNPKYCIRLTDVLAALPLVVMLDTPLLVDYQIT
jgi:hypothetical protein